MVSIEQQRQAYVIAEQQKRGHSPHYGDALLRPRDSFPNSPNRIYAPNEPTRNLYGNNKDTYSMATSGSRSKSENIASYYAAPNTKYNGKNSDYQNLYKLLKAFH